MARHISARLDAEEGRKFGLTIGIAFVVLAGVLLWRERELLAEVFAGTGVLLIVSAVVLPARLKPVERAWMAFALQISKVTTPIIMGIVYFLVVTPIAVIVRRVKGNPIVHTPGPDGYWHRRDGEHEPKSDMRRQF